MPSNKASITTSMLLLFTITFLSHSPAIAFHSPIQRAVPHFRTQHLLNRGFPALGPARLGLSTSARIQMMPPPPPQPKRGPPINEEITAPEVRVIVDAPGGEDEMLGVMDIQAALGVASDAGVDLVLIAPDGKPPVCKVVDYGKFRYAKEKKQKEALKQTRQNSSTMKELKFSYNIETHDYQVRQRSAVKFLKQGNRVKAVVRFRGREIQHTDLAVNLMRRFADDCSEFGTAEGMPRRDGRIIVMVLAPKKT